MLSLSTESTASRSRQAATSTLAKVSGYVTCITTGFNGRCGVLGTLRGNVSGCNIAARAVGSWVAVDNLSTGKARRLCLANVVRNYQSRFIVKYSIDLKTLLFITTSPHIYFPKVRSSGNFGLCSLKVLMVL